MGHGASSHAETGKFPVTAHAETGLPLAAGPGVAEVRAESESSPESSPRGVEEGASASASSSTSTAKVHRAKSATTMGKHWRKHEMSEPMSPGHAEWFATAKEAETRVAMKKQWLENHSVSVELDEKIAAQQAAKRAAKELEAATRQKERHHLAKVWHQVLEVRKYFTHAKAHCQVKVFQNHHGEIVLVADHPSKTHAVQPIHFHAHDVDAEKAAAAKKSPTQQRRRQLPASLSALRAAPALSPDLHDALVRGSRVTLRMQSIESDDGTEQRLSLDVNGVDHDLAHHRVDDLDQLEKIAGPIIRDANQA